VSDKKLKIMLIDEQPERFELLDQALCAHGHEIVARISTDEDINRAVELVQPDIIIIDLESPGRDTLEHMQVISRDRPRPIVMFTNDGDNVTIERAVKAGVSAYVVDGLNPARIRSILNVAIHRFREFQQLRNELEQTRIQLNERKLVEKAKGILMKKRSLDEEQAYQMLRKMAMDRNLKLVELARSIIAAAELLE
jgi:two-component system, response regulator / RNA-binding antiterminator